MYEIFVDLLQQRGITPYQVAKATGVSNGCLSDWKRGRSTPKYEALSKIADYFGVSVDYLLGKNDIKKTPHGSEALQQLLDESNAHMAVVIGKGKERRIIEVPADAEEIIRSTLETFKNKEK